MDREVMVRGFIRDTFLLGSADSLASSQSLLAQGVIDSTGVLELIAFLEKSFSISIADQEVQASNFDSIDNILRFLDRKLGAEERGNGPGS